MTSSLLVRSGTILTLNSAFEVLEGDLSIVDGRIAAIAPHISARHERVIDARGGFILPGFVQTHVHLCQTLFRGYADDLPLMEWLSRRVWPLEAAHTPVTLAAAAELAAVELLASGTTTVLTMETVHDTDAVFEAIAATGLRATIGKCMMDRAGGAPARLHEQTTASIEESQALRRRWHGAADGRLRTAYAPRFAVSCSRDLLEAVADLSRQQDALVHTHAAESLDELRVVKDVSGGLANVDYLSRLGLASPRLCAAHCVWVDEGERRLLAERDVKVLHCPSSNLKLGSGIAPVAELRSLGITVSLGADGAACNNRLDMFDEMRLAALLQAVRLQPGALTARDALLMATRDGARTLGLESEIGSLEVGKAADIVVIDRDRPHLASAPDPYSAVVYAARGSDVRATIVAGDVLVDEFDSVRVDRGAVLAAARDAARQLASRAGLSS